MSKIRIDRFLAQENFGTRKHSRKLVLLLISKLLNSSFNFINNSKIKIHQLFLILKKI